MLKKIIVTVIMAMPIGVLATETVISEVPSKQLFSQELVTDLIKTRITGDQSLAFNVVRQALADFPDEVVPIVISAMQAGASTIDIARQCDTDIPARIIPDLVYAAISQDADPELMIARCLCAVPIDQAPNALAVAMNNAGSDQLEAIVATAERVFQGCGIDGSTILIAALVATATRAPQDCSIDETTILIDSLIAAMNNADPAQQIALLATAMQNADPTQQNALFAAVIQNADPTQRNALFATAMQNADPTQQNALFATAMQNADPSQQNDLFATAMHNADPTQRNALFATAMKNANPARQNALFAAAMNNADPSQQNAVFAAAMQDEDFVENVISDDIEEATSTSFSDPPVAASDTEPPASGD